MQPTPEQWARIKEIVANALEIPRDRRAAFVQEACGGDPSLLEEAESLLAYQQTVVMTAPVDEELSRGTLLCGRYLVERTLGHGGFATAWLAYDQQLLNRRVVIKLLATRNADSYVRRKFADELRALSALEHPHIIAPLDSGLTAGGAPFIVTQFAEGSTLGRILEAGTPPLDRTIHILEQLGHTLSFIHAAGIIHRDLKPENIIVQTFADGVDHVRLIDFGIASIDAAGLDRSTRIVGSLVYMAPEQLFGTVSIATDMYALGVIAHEMLTLEVPFSTNNPAELAQLHAKGMRVQPRELRPDLPLEAEELLLKALHRDPAKRPVDAAQFADRLGELLKKRTQPKRSSLVPSLVSVALTVLLAIAVILAFTRSRASKASAGAAPVKAAAPLTTPGPSLTLAVLRRMPPGPLAPNAGGQLTLQSGDEFRILLQPRLAGHLYVFSETAGSSNLHILFPSATSKTGGSLLNALQSVQIPQISWFRIDTRTSSGLDNDRLDLAWSPTAVPEFEAALRFANASNRGEIPDGLQRSAIRRLLQNAPGITPAGSGWILTANTPGGLLVGQLKIVHGQTSP